mmetsp:Transcript_23996/g.59499  ORF Transcript_23996/g.59499 Transcript_23996/m.59499 type:complete len:259 (+) Transcript_23996:500-1276(+)
MWSAAAAAAVVVRSSASALHTAPHLSAKCVRRETLHPTDIVSRATMRDVMVTTAARMRSTARASASTAACIAAASAAFSAAVTASATAAAAFISAASDACSAAVAASTAAAAVAADTAADAISVNAAASLTADPVCPVNPIRSTALRNCMLAFESNRIDTFEVTTVASAASNMRAASSPALSAPNGMDSTASVLDRAKVPSSGSLPVTRRSTSSPGPNIPALGLTNTSAAWCAFTLNAIEEIPGLCTVTIAGGKSHPL